MRKPALLTCALLLVASAFTPTLFAQRGRGGGGFGAGGGFRGGAGGGYSGARPAAPVARPSGFTAPARTSAPRPAVHNASPAHQPAYGNRASGVGPSGGSWQAGKGGGSYTTNRGGTIDYKGAAIGGTGAGGISGGRYVGGVQITTAGGQTINHAGRGGAASGPGGNTVGGRSGISNTYGPNGSGASASRSGFASGPNGAVAGRSGVAVGPNGAVAGRSGVAVGPNGAVAGRSGVAVGPNGAVAGRSGVAVGPNGAVAGRSAVAVTSHGTYYHSAGAVHGQGVYVRSGCAHYHNCFTRGWYAQYPGAWFTAGLVAGAAWNSASYSDVYASGGYPSQPVTYDYGSNVVYEGDQVYVNGDAAGTTAEYSQQATAIADAGNVVDPAKEKEGDWIPLGVFAMVRGEETTSDNIFQLAVNKDGIVRGNYYNALTDAAEPVHGSVDKKSQRAAWVVGDRKHPVYESGIVNLTTDSTTMMVHYNEDKSQQFTLFRIDKSADAGAKQTPAPAVGMR
jgi:hypothetical protein